MSPVERFKCAASLQVLYEDLETYKDDIKTYEDWMIILERLEAMKSLNKNLFYECISERWISIGWTLVESLSDEEIYCVIEKLSTLRSYGVIFRSHYIFDGFAFQLLKKLGIEDIIFWGQVFDRLTIITQANQKFWKTLVLEHFLPRAEKFIDGGYISQVHWLLQKVSNLDLQINEKYVKSFVLTICRQKVFRYTYAKTSVEMYIDMMSIVGEMLHDGSLVEVNQDENSL
eukprot:TRINITY_DN2164_c0_g1_i3.p2 TRINITY_DN2164_c0_g1~~TRINITY_DN2164_c0_g1_i3.p2  ORF type:complete len:230 (-),score=12.72 TRINITY_DN2164_c0_g1_i3:31-720(-)